MVATHFDKFRLLMWKNWLLQSRHKIQFIIEILVPVLFSGLLVLIRILVESKDFTKPLHYPPVGIDSLDPLRFSLETNSVVNFTLLYTPKNHVFDELLIGIVDSLKLDGIFGIENAELLESQMLRHPYLAGVVFHHNANITELPEYLDYSLRFPAELRTLSRNPLLFNWQTNRFVPKFQEPGPRVPVQSDGGLPPGYRREGFLAIQNGIAQEFLKLHTNFNETMPEIFIQRYPHPPYQYDMFLIGLEGIVSLIIVMSFVYPCINTVKFIATEKEKQLKEAMKIMGLSSWLHWTSWFVRSLLFMIVSITLIVIFWKIRWTENMSSAVFTHADAFVLWIFLLVYSISTIMYCFMMSVFFKQANTAAAVAGIGWFVLYAAYSFTLQSYDEMNLVEKLLLCLLLNTGMSFGIQSMLRYEGIGEGIQWSNLWEPVTVDDNLTVGHVMIMTLVAGFIYLLIALYVERIYPGDFGVAEKWYFPLTKNFWFGNYKIKYFGAGTFDDLPIKKHTKFENYRQDSSFFENNPTELVAGIQLQNLGKIYNKDKIAVRGINLEMFNNQITVLLGHNGAGKTTTMSMLCGMFPPTSGTALINGFDIQTNTRAARNSLGICPQHNILFDELTVREHIEFYARLKGVSKKDEVNKEIDKYLRLIDLEDKRNAQSKTLSGGMKRKLSVCVAFCGGSKVVLCDEPTSGMDPAARRSMWDFLKEEKLNRTILLSTHFMDEADVLGDRIAIMGNGEIRCSGSSYFLKKTFGTGYHLICVKDIKRANQNELLLLLRKYIPLARIESDVGTELSVQLPYSSVDGFKNMFKELEERQFDLGIISYGVSQTTMEEVFMTIGEDTLSRKSDDFDYKLDDSLAGNCNDNNGGGAGDIPDEKVKIMDDLYLLTGFPLFLLQVVALFKKKIIQTTRNWLIFLVQMFIPMLFVILTVLSERSRTTFSSLPPLTLSLKSQLQTILVLEANPLVEQDSIVSKMVFEYRQASLINPLATVDLITSNFDEYIYQLSETKLTQVNQKYLIGATITNSSRLTSWFNNQGYHTAGFSVEYLHNAVIKSYLGGNYGISVINEPLPYSVETKNELALLAQSMGFQLAVYVGFAMAFVAAFYVLSYIREEQSRSKLLQFVNGARVIAYWTTAYVWDYLTYFLTIVILVCTFAAFQESGWSTPTELMRILLVLMVFGYSVIPLTYVASRFFLIPATGFTRMTMIFVLTGMASFFIIYIMSLEMYNLEHLAKKLKWVLLIFPHFALSHSLNNINYITQYREMCQVKCNFYVTNCTEDLVCAVSPDCCNNDYFSWTEPGVGRELVYMITVGTCAIITLLLIEFGIFNNLSYKLQKVFNWNSKRYYSAEDSVAVEASVLEEKFRVQTMSSFEIQTQGLVIKNLWKSYGKNNIAVRDLSIGIDGAECFGLLGVNGAGKTTTFKMLIGDERISSGEAWIRGLSLKSNLTKVYQTIGYCPQFDALIDEQTGRETMEMYCRLRGVPSRNIPVIIARLARELNFIRHLDKMVKEYSGGNKRKLSTAIALIGNPAVVYLDEPTTGMDPGAKRQLWNIISQVRASGKSIILTSHSMDECEALCTRIAIMVNGEFKCLGSTQYLKNKYGKGFTLQIRLNTNVRNDKESLAVKNFIDDQFKGAKLRSEYQGLLEYYIPNTMQRWSTMFGKMEEAKKQFKIVDYSLCQTTLEQVFLSFAKHQK